MPELPNYEVALDVLSTGLRVDDAVGWGGEAHGRILCQRIDVLPNPATWTLPLKGMVTFQFDDGKETWNTWMKPVFDDKGVPCSLGIVTDLVGENLYMTWETILAAQTAGHEICSHSKTHTYWNTLNEAETEEEISGALEAFEAQGISAPPCFIVPGHVYSNAGVKLLRKYHLCARGLSSNDIANEYAPDPVYLRAQQADGGGIGEAEMEAMVDLAYAQGRWLIFYEHEGSEARAAIYSNVIDHIQAKGDMPIVNTLDGYNAMGFSVVAGEPGVTSVGGFVLTGHGDVRTRTISAIESLRLYDSLYPYDNYVDVSYSAGHLRLMPYSTAHDILLHDCQEILPSRSVGTSRRVVTIGKAGQEFESIWCKRYGCCYGNMVIGSEDSIFIYVGVTQDNDDLATGTLAITVRESDGATLVKLLDFEADDTPTEPAAGRAVLWVDSSGDIWVGSNVGGTSKKTKIHTHATADAW